MCFLAFPLKVDNRPEESCLVNSGRSASACSEACRILHHAFVWLKNSASWRTARQFLAIFGLWQMNLFARMCGCQSDVHDPQPEIPMQQVKAASPFAAPSPSTSPDTTKRSKAKSLPDTTKRGKTKPRRRAEQMHSQT